jgi:hypothetical protein
MCPFECKVIYSISYLYDWTTESAFFCLCLSRQRMKIAAAVMDKAATTTPPTARYE